MAVRGIRRGGAGTGENMKEKSQCGRGRPGDVSVTDMFQKTLFALLYSLTTQQNVTYL